MASSIISPKDAAMAPSVIMLNVCPVRYKTIAVSPRVTGIVIKIVALALADFKNKMATIIANNNPSNKLSLTL